MIRRSEIKRCRKADIVDKVIDLDNQWIKSKCLYNNM